MQTRSSARRADYDARFGRSLDSFIASNLRAAMRKGVGELIVSEVRGSKGGVWAKRSVVMKLGDKSSPRAPPSTTTRSTSERAAARVQLALLCAALTMHAHYVLSGTSGR